VADNKAMGVSQAVIYRILALILPKMDKKFSYLQCRNLKYSNEK